MNYFAIPGLKHHHRNRTVGEPFPDRPRVMHLQPDDVFIIQGVRYKVVQIKSNRVYYKLFWKLKMTGPLQVMAAGSMERIQITGNVPHQNPGVHRKLAISYRSNRCSKRFAGVYSPLNL